MHIQLQDIPLAFALIGLALYSVLGGADFGAGVWTLTAGPGAAGRRIRDHAHHSMGPVWEANHVWLIFVLTVMWTAYPTALASIASTLSVALLVAGLGIIVRGAAYALRAGTKTQREERAVDTLTGLSSILTPFALGAAVGGIASRRVPVGNAAGSLISSWLNPTSILIGGLAVASSAYLAAVYLAADAARHGDAALERSFRTRALMAGVLAGAIALGGLLVVHGDAHPLYHGLTHAGLPAVIVSAIAGLGTFTLVWSARLQAARYTAAIAVGAIIAGWALAQQPILLPGLTIAQAAAPRDTLIAITVAIVAGGAILAPSLALLFNLALTGQLDHDPGAAAPAPARVGDVLSAAVPGLLLRVSGASLLIALTFLTAADAQWAHIIGVSAILVFVVTGFFAATPEEVASAPLRE